MSLLHKDVLALLDSCLETRAAWACDGRSTPMRYEFGPNIQYVRPDPTPPGPKPDALVAIAELTESTITLAITAPEPSYNHPAELRVYLVAQGTELPGDVQGYIDSAFPVSIYTVSETDTFGATVVLPDVPRGDYLLQTVVGFTE